MKRRAGELLALEHQILQITAARRDETYGFALAEELARGDGGGDDKGRLIGHGTLYKALDRLREQGFLESRWEDPRDAERERRPRRRLYRITDAGRVAMALTTSKRADARRAARGATS